MIHPVYNQGVYAQLQGVGLGKLKPNVVFMGYSGLWHRNKVKPVAEWHQIVSGSLGLCFFLSFLLISTVAGKGPDQT